MYKVLKRFIRRQGKNRSTTPLRKLKLSAVRFHRLLGMGLYSAPKVFLDSLKIPIKTYVYNHFSYIRGVDWGGGGDTKPRMRGRKWKISEVRST